MSSRIKNAWNAFNSKNTTTPNTQLIGSGSYYDPSKTRRLYADSQTMVNSIMNRIAIDVANTDIRHVTIDSNTSQFSKEISDSLDMCLTLAANLDQTGMMLIQDFVLTVLSEGVAAIVPIDTSTNIGVTDSYNILSMRVGKIVQWYPHHIKVEVYNENKGETKQLIFPKAECAIVENPMYGVMNAPNSTLRRLNHKLALLDAADDQQNSGNLDIIIQLPYNIRSDLREEQAKKRRDSIQQQLSDGHYGIAYTGADEHITQLNRPVTNGLVDQIDKLEATLYDQLGMTKEVFAGTADEKTMLNYQNRTVKPILKAIVNAMNRSFFTKTAYTQGHRIMYFQDPFDSLALSDAGDLVDKVSRNAIMTPNELRAKVFHLPPSTDNGADELSNKNLNPPSGSEGSLPITNNQEDYATDQEGAS